VAPQKKSLKMNKLHFFSRPFLNPTEQDAVRLIQFQNDQASAGVELSAIGIAMMSAFAVIAFFSVAIHQKTGPFFENFEDLRQLSRLLVAITGSGFLLLKAARPDCSLQKLRTASNWIWFFMTFGLTMIIAAHFQMSMEGLSEEPPHGRYTGAVLMITIVLYMLGTLRGYQVAFLMAPATIIALSYNNYFLSAIEFSSSVTYFVIAHFIGASFNQYRLKREIELFVKKQELNQALETIRQSEAREKEISAAKTRLIGTVSHDLRQPLNSLALYNNLLKTKYLGEDAGLHSISERIHECVAAMEGNLTRLQDIAQLQARPVPVPLRPVSLNESLLRIRAVFESVAHSSNVKLKVHIRSAQDPHLASHSERLFEILANLTSNAIKFSASQQIRPAWVLVRAISIKKSGGESQIRIDLRDNGVGISQQNHARIFDEYIQLNNPQRQSAKGYGLGLSVVRELCNSLGGHTVTLRSSLDRGACFSVYINEISSEDLNAFPQTDGETKNNQASLSESNTDLNGCKSLSGHDILLIEDDDSLRNAISIQLHEYGASVRAYPSGKHALAATGNDIRSPSCIVSDYWLPEPFDGVQTVTLLREQFGEIIPALIISAAADINPNHVTKLAATEFALKPVAPITLLNFVRKQRIDNSLFGQGA
jgi:signal transduction histidine kinase/CheY-like chemotaxis protein